MAEFSKVCVVGLGYVGLPTAAIFASHGVEVVGVDVNPRTVETINSGRAPIVEPDLDTLVEGAVARGRLRATVAPEGADAFILAVPTPFKNDHEPDLSYLFAAADSIAPVLAAGNLVVVESTVPVGATERVRDRLAEARPDLRFPGRPGDGAPVNVAHSPERVLPGRVLVELVSNDRVIGGLGETCAERAASLYRLAVQGRLHRTTARTAELVKLSENAFRDVNIAFANELHRVADKLGIDVWEAIELANRHPRVNILNPGPGVGGHCIAVDPWFIHHSAPKETPLIETARKVNDGKPALVAEKIASLLPRPDAGVACLGLAYKADIDDLRESPSVEVVRLLAERGVGPVYVVEPHVEILPAPLSDLAGVSLVGIEDALSGSAVVALLTDHRPFRDIGPDLLEGKETVDTRGFWRRRA